MKPSVLDTLTGQIIGISARPVPRSAIDAWQEDRLRRLVAYCRDHAPFYQRKFAAVGIAAVDGLADLARLPLTTEAELRHHGQEMVCVGQDAVARIVTLHSSGTTGPPKRLWFTEADLERTLDFFHHGMGQMAEPGQTAAILLPGATPDSTGHLLARALARMTVNGRIVGLVSEPAQAARIVAEMRPEILVGFPVQILALARMAAFLRLDLASIGAVLLCSDYVSESLCQSLQELLGCEIFTHYGATETGLGGGVDCGAHHGCHLREADLLVEIVDPGGGQALPAGEWGEIVCTTLMRTGMPLIRYRTGDRGRLLPGRCRCGSQVRRLDRVLGRLDRVRTLQSGRQLAMADLDEWLFAVPGLLDFTAALAIRDGRESLELVLAVLPGRGEAAKRQAARLLESRMSRGEPAIDLKLAMDGAIHPAKRFLEDHRKERAT
ncbi:MAG: AMP-binding protein [Desulfobulbus sp.]|jgi:phenylacetate-coenzyme A ligase PaaK-like adenylate-forming protein|uniref:DVU_1553 family AMP-dependent CoA ligase n=1 Tax=Desulfobulbus sp. TaxID=895 RepID=UPI002843D78C|nr:AMP-binding protein [Desulfobulbus sp.]MDR2549053.1 AMP-binding protein [Desulfobulbus sp.]